MSEYCISLFGGDGVDWEKVSCVAVVTTELDPALAVSGEREDLRLYRDLETARCCHNDDLQSAHWERQLISEADPWMRPRTVYKPRHVRTKQLRLCYLPFWWWDLKCVLLIKLKAQTNMVYMYYMHYKIQTHPWVLSNTQQTSTLKSSRIEYTGCQFDCRKYTLISRDLNKFFLYRTEAF